MCNRVKKLKARVYEAAFKPGYCVERAYWMTKSYMETEGEPAVLRRAKALKKILENMTITIEDGELIVGKPTSKLVGSPLFPEINWYYLNELVDSKYLNEEEKAKLKEVILYWKGKSFSEAASLRLPEEFKTDIVELVLDASRRSHIAHCSPNYDKVLKEGLNGIRKRVEDEIAKLDLTKAENVKKLAFLEAVKVALEAIIIFAQRYANLAKRLIIKEGDPKRKAELEKIAKICENVPANPAGNLHEALQAVWFVYIALAMEGLAAGIGFGRMDQYLYPYYKKDLEEGRLTKEEARELLALFLIKMNELAFHFPGAPPNTIEQYRSGSEQTLSSITIGGVIKDGLDATNELSYLFLDAEMDAGLLEDIVVRIHRALPYSFLIKACETARALTGKMKFVSDETAIKQLIKDGKSLEDARDYAVMGCFIRTVPGRSFDPPVIGGGVVINLPMALELALNNGVSRLINKQIGLKTGDPRKFKSFNELWLAYKKQVEFIVRKAVIFSNFIYSLYSELLPYPLMSALFDGCVENGKDITEGGTIYGSQNFWVCGVVNVGDSLAALKKVVFEDKKILMDTLIDALNENFEGYEQAYFLLRNAPKFGNDDDYVDSIVNEVLINICEEVENYIGYSGRKFTVAAAHVISHIPLGKVTGATPEGRKACEPFGDGGVSPYYGRNINGITSTFRSVAKLDLWRASGGAVLNIKFNPNDVQEENKIESKMRKFASLLKTFAKIGGDIVQFSFVSSEMLRNAQKTPEKYRDLLVRVATYSAYFVDLPKDVQDDIIRRTEIRGS